MAEVHVSKRFKGPAERMWKRIGDPLRLAEWHPAIESTEALDSGRGRINSLVGGGEVRETLLEQSANSHAWRIDESPLPVKTLTASITVRAEGPASCSVDWSATLVPNGVPEADAVEIVHGFFQAGLDALARG